MLVPLFKREDDSLYSLPFSVSAKEACILLADGLESWRTRSSAGQIKVPQMVCVHKVIQGFIPPSGKGCSCGWVYDIDPFKAREITDVQVSTANSGPWRLTLDDNTRIIGVPGVYRLKFNDAVNRCKIQVWAEIVGADDVAPNMKDIFFN